jgi:hypothetical protein
MKTIDRVFSCLLFLGGVGHTLGCFAAYGSKPELLLWSLSASLFLFLLAALNFVRAGRSGDRTLGWITLIFNPCQFVAAIQFGRVIQNLLDPRVIGFCLITLVLTAMSMRSINLAARPRERTEYA